MEHPKNYTVAGATAIAYARLLLSASGPGPGPLGHFNAVMHPTEQVLDRAIKEACDALPNV